MNATNYRELKRIPIRGNSRLLSASSVEESSDNYAKMKRHLKEGDE